MKVERIYTRSIVGTKRGCTIEEAARMMRKFHIGALLVMGDEPQARDIVGIVTDRDLVLQAVAEGLAPGEVTVGEVMTPEVVTVAEDADLHEALERMRSAGVRRLLVKEADGTAAGILSLDDVVDGLSADLASLAHVVKNEMRGEANEYDGVL